MRIEARLHDAMHEHADAIEPEPGSWSRIAARFDEEPTPRRPARGGLVFAGVAITLVIALIAVLVVRDDSGDGTRVSTGPAVGMPARIFAVNADGHATILDSRTGDQQGGIYEAPTVGEGTQIAVTPDGQDAYLVQGNGNEGCADHSILRLPVGSGARGGDQIATESTDPTVSPDGRYLAYLHCLPGDNRADEIVLRDLTSGEERVTAGREGTFFINRLEFAADSRNVYANVFDDALGRARLYEIDVVSGAPGPGQLISDGGPGWSAVRGSTGELLGIQSPPLRVVSLRGSPLTPSPLFDAPAGVRQAPTQLASDASGRHLLMVLDHSLYRWSEGEASATKIADAVIGAAWIPDGSPAPPPPVSPNAPGAVLAAVGGNRLAFLASANGSEQTSYGSYPGISSVSVTPDGKEILFSHTGPSGACAGPAPEVDRLSLATGTATPTVGGAVTPVVSPDGRFVAYGITCDGPALGLTNLATGQNYRTDPLGGIKHETSANIESVEVLGWSPDSTRMLYRLTLEGDASPHYYVGRLWPAVPQSETKVTELPSGRNIVGATFIDDGTVALAETTGNGSEVRRWTVSHGPEEPRSPALFGVPGQVTSLVADPSGRHFLALVALAPDVPAPLPVREHPLGGNARTLYRWSVGDPAPTKIAGDLTAASWAPWWGSGGDPSRG